MIHSHVSINAVKLTTIPLYWVYTGWLSMMMRVILSLYYLIQQNQYAMHNNGVDKTLEWQPKLDRLLQ